MAVDSRIEARTEHSRNKVITQSGLLGNKAGLECLNLVFNKHLFCKKDKVKWLMPLRLF